MFRWGSRGMVSKSASEVEDDRLLDQLQTGFDAQNRKKREQQAPSCAFCDDSAATISCVDKCGDAFYCSNECVLLDARRYRSMCLNLRLSMCGAEGTNDEDGDNAGETANDSDDYENDVDEISDDPFPVEASKENSWNAPNGDMEFTLNVENLRVASTQDDKCLHRVESIQVTCPHCDEIAVITSKVLRREDSKQKISTTCICGEVVGFWI
ncbi:hypothetical protein H310_00255 [Aphanomyces invadans]|uniref:MYND-type domain-containing protein n=1 Tax=Aphanomyces invadans TaxID=157072 RepID=A0A024UVU0_9STRA|nr:hypothetical protein H310_00255 [Aphanomyces invadans]ETW09773.1 hypothetical protein H310_00255 [Aphanomyces invadans]|eukprot:XP_008861184.1 hypothetical protein H310_00255 [Aphanomyces invadans]